MSSVTTRRVCSTTAAATSPSARASTASSAAFHVLRIRVAWKPVVWEISSAATQATASTTSARPGGVNVPAHHTSIV
jgi:hypothetical protein